MWMHHYFVAKFTNDFQFCYFIVVNKKKQRNDKPGKQHNLQNKNNIQTITNKIRGSHENQNEQGDGEKKIYNKTTYTVSIHSRPNG